MEDRLHSYFATLGRLAVNARVTRGDGGSLPLSEFFETMTADMRQVHERGNKLMFVGNGGSAAIASHLAIDFSKNGGLRAMAFNDYAALTCLANDLGYDQVFAHQIEMHACEADMLFAISSSGASENILNAVRAARAAGAHVLTLSGFAADNPLRRLGDFNLYVSSQEYGFVEVTHLALCHALLDIAQGWGTVEAGSPVRRHKAW